MLPEYALGLLEPEQLSSVEAHVLTCSECERELKKVEMAVNQLQTLQLPPERLWGKVQRSVSGANAFSHFNPALCELFDLSPDVVTALLGQLDDETLWMPGPVEGTRMFPVNVGERLSGAMAAFVELQPGATFPDHEHLAEERNLLLQGGYTDSDGREFWRGEVDVKATGSSHHFTGLAGLPCLVAVVLSPIADGETGQ
jgi:putative transcriptional regulator